ncbi:protocadherin-8 [Amblyraja radiata]|uniref:protocadherin-8 n=1 Tax=Amblyraja radiata TaxID=386614 RepID=UPI0014020301|nr:protocadherin-8 [Amblyraja radiata]
MMTGGRDRNNFAAPVSATIPGLLRYLLLVLLTAPTADCLTANYSVYEEEPPGTVIGNLAADLQLEAAGSFRLMQKFNGSLVEVGETDGQLRVGGRIDREQLCPQQARAGAGSDPDAEPQPQLEPCSLLFDVVNLSGDKFVLIRVEVRVRDINDHAPDFGRPEVLLEISESSVLGTRVPLEPALDPDLGANSLLKYRLSPSRPFALEQRIGADGLRCPELVLVERLDRESQAELLLQLEAEDGGNSIPARTATVRLRVQVLDSNDNSPAFERSAVVLELREDAAPGSLLLQLRATDPDLGANGEIIYSLSPQLPAAVRRLFHLDARSGRLSLAARLDRERAPALELEVRARDRGHPPSAAAVCSVTVRVLDVNDNAPEIGVAPLVPDPVAVPVTAVVSEAAAPGSLVALVTATDRDAGANGRVHCALSPPNGHFELRRAHGSSLLLLTAAPLDRERVADYNLTLVAEDGGAPPRRTQRALTVRVSDVNDNAPAFSRRLYHVSLAENNRPGAHMTTVQAHDPDLAHNGRLTYRLLGPGAALASIHPATGAIYALRSFDREALPEAELLVRVTDGGSPPLSSSATVRLTVTDRNDNAPVITHPLPGNANANVNGNASVCVITLPRHAGAGHLATRMRARDADQGVNAELSYRLLSGAQAGDGLFSIERRSGDVRLGRPPTPEPGDGTGAWRLVVAVSDNGQPALSATATLHFVLEAEEEAAGPGRRRRLLPGQRGWDTSLVVIVVLAGGCAALIVAILIIATACGRVGKAAEWGAEVRPPEDGLETRMDSPGDGRCDGAELPAGGVKLYPALGDRRASEPQHFVSTSGFSQTLHPFTIWQGKQFTLSKSELASQPRERFSGKDSGKGDSDFNDSDSDISGIGLSKRNALNPKQNGLWTCTSECKILGHSDRCWSPSSQGPKTYSSTGIAEHLNTFGKSISLPRELLRKDTYYQALLPKTAGLQSVYQKVACNESETGTSPIVPIYNSVGPISHKH